MPDKMYCAVKAVIQREDGNQVMESVFRANADHEKAVITDDEAEKLHGFEWFLPNEPAERKLPVPNPSFYELLKKI